MVLDKTTLKTLWPNASQILIDEICARSQGVFQKYGINTPLRLAHFMAQISHESDGGRIKEENMNYRTAERIVQVWPKRFTINSARAFVGKPRELANKVYNGRMGNRVGSDDGYNFRGRGLLQLTGRESYSEIGKLTGLDLITNPSLVSAPQNALEIAACEFKKLNCLEPADNDDIRTVTLRVNGGNIGIDSRRAWLTKWKLALPSLPGELPKGQEAIAEISDEQMPREADGDSSPVKSLEKSKTIWGGILGWLTGAGSAVFGLFEHLNNAYTLTAFLVVLTLATVALFLIIKGRIDINTIVKKLSGDQNA